ncbi:hypothetical protein, partial [Aeromonas caviae]|uniref:hypothetical protein n=1 Tax=Aeromonas caviae TaxID=648 RepID=UPI001F31F891
MTIPVTGWLRHLACRPDDANRQIEAYKKGSSRDPGKVEVDRQGAGKLVVAKHTTTITLLSPCIILILP